MSAQVSASGSSRWSGGKGGVRFDRQLVARQVRRGIRQRRVDVVERLARRLPGQTVHQIEIEVVEMASGDVDRLSRLAVVMDAAKRLQVFAG
jgi:hypothetical protein